MATISIGNGNNGEDKTEGARKNNVFGTYLHGAFLPKNPEFADYINECKFTSCAHLCEKGCAVIEAVENGIIPKSRHESYVRMYDEVKDIKDWQLK